MISAIIPWQPGCAHRQQNLPWVVQQLEPLVDEVVIGEISGPWSKAEAVAKGLETARGDVLVIHDADVWVQDPSWVTDCLKALYTVSAVAPHSTVRRLPDAVSTRSVVGGANPYSFDSQNHRARFGGGIVVLERSTYEHCPLDPRFVGWGQEDESWAIALDVLFGRCVQQPRDLIHLWHPPQERLDRRWGSQESTALYKRYETAAESREAMLDLIAEVRYESFLDQPHS